MTHAAADDATTGGGRPGGAPTPKLSQRLGKLTGAIFAIACLAFVALRLAKQWQQISPLLNSQLLLVGAVGSVVYFAANFLLSFAWYRLLLFCGGTPPSQLLCHVVYGTTQIGKYLPGNVFHFVGRQFVGRAAKMSDSALALSALLEIATFPAAAGAFALIAGGTTPFEDAGVSVTWLWVGAGSVLLALAVLPRLVPAVVKKLGLPADEVSLTVTRLPLLMVPFASYLAFLLVSASVCLALALAASPGPVPVAYLFASYPVAWILGFVIPGASGGIGVREAVLVTLLGSTMGEPVVLVMALTFRGVTILGEVCFFLVARALKRRLPPEAAL